MGDYGFKITKEGFDVDTATDDQLVLSSKFQNFVVVQEGSGTAPGGVGDQTISINNNLDFPTVFYVWEKAGWKANSWRCNYKSYIDAGDSMKLKLVIPAGTDYYYMITNQRLDSTVTSLAPTGNNYGLKISKAGSDVDNATWDNISFISSKRNLQVWGSYEVGYTYFSGDGVVHAPNTYYEFSVAHGKSYTPLFRDVCSGFREDALVGANLTGPSELFASYNDGDGLPQNLNIEVCVDATNIWLRAKSTEGLDSVGFIFGLSSARAKVWIIGAIP